MTRLIKPYISFDEVEKEFREIFESGIFTKGKYVHEFEKVLKQYTGANYCFLATSATTALSMALKVIDVKPGDEVIVSDFSFPATVNVVEDLYAIPIFADVDKTTYNMRPEELESKITNKTKAVIFVDALGNPSGITKIKKICNKYQIPLIEDAACALGSSENGIKVGSIADLTCFSFHPRKLLTTGEGGAILTNNERYKKVLEVKLAHGAINNNGKFDFIDYGYNYRLPELQAVMGIKQVVHLDDIIRRRQAIKAEYVKKLEHYGFIPQATDTNVNHNTQSVVFYVPKNINRDALCIYLKEHEIESTIGTYCLSDCTYYVKKYNQRNPIAHDLFKHTITLPCQDDCNINEVCNVIISYVKGDNK